MSKTKLDCLKLINSIENSLEFKKKIIASKKILIAYSGGQDSSSLLTIFYILSKKWKFQLGVVYCNHGWNKSTEATLTAFTVLQNYKVPFYIIDIAPEIIQKSENKARQWRYSAFEEIMQYGKYDFLLTGHTLSDKIETIIFNLCRGTGLKGICSLNSFKTFNKRFNQSQTFNFKYKIMNLSDVVSNNSLINFFLQNKVTNQTDFLKLFNYYILNCYLKKIKIVEVLPLVALPFFSPILKIKIKQWQFKYLNIGSNLSTYFLKSNETNSEKFNNVTKKLNFVSQSIWPPKNKQYNFTYSFLYNPHKKLFFSIKENSSIALLLVEQQQIKKFCLSFSIKNKTKKKKRCINSFQKSNNYLSSIIFFNPAIYISAQRFLFNWFIFQTSLKKELKIKNHIFYSLQLSEKEEPFFYLQKSSLLNKKIFRVKHNKTKYKLNTLKNSIFLQSSTTFFTLKKNSRFLISAKAQKTKQLTFNFLKSSKIPNILFASSLNNKTCQHRYLKFQQHYFYLKLNNNQILLFLNKPFNFYWSLKNNSKILFNYYIKQKFYNFDCFNNQFKKLLKKKTKEKINFNYYYCSKKMLNLNLNNQYILKYTAFLKQNFDFSYLKHCKQKHLFLNINSFGGFFFKSKNTSKQFLLLNQFRLNLNNYAKKTQKSSLLNCQSNTYTNNLTYFNKNFSVSSIYKNRKCSFLFLNQCQYFQKKVLLKYFIRKKIFSLFLTSKFYKKKILQNNASSLKFKLRVLRPLLKIDRSTIFLFTNQLNLPLFVDQSNFNLNISRNFIRKKIIPLLKKVNPKTEQNLYKFSQIANFYYRKNSYIKCPPQLLETFKI